MAVTELRRARVAAAIAFLLTGANFAAWSSRIPSIKQDLELSDGQLGISLAILNLGAIVGLQAGGLVVARFGSRRSLRFALPLFSSALILPAVASNLVWLGAALFTWAAVNSVVDVAMNAQGVLVECHYDRPVLSGLHSMHSIGGICGAAGGYLAAQAGLGPTDHFTAVAVVAACIAVAAGRFLLPGDHDERPSSPVAALFSAWPRVLLILGVAAFCLTLVEGSVLDWSAVFLHDHLHATNATAGLTVTAFLTTMAIGRLAGDRVAHRLGRRRAIRIGCALACTGQIVALTAPSPAIGILGFTVLGLGLSGTLPIALSAAGHNSDTATAVARVSMLAYAGSFTGPWIIGTIADRIGLVTALTLPALSLVLAGVLARIPSD